MLLTAAAQKGFEELELRDPEAVAESAVNNRFDYD